jgi:hypothetical protein
VSVHELHYFQVLDFPLPSLPATPTSPVLTVGNQAFDAGEIDAGVVDETLDRFQSRQLAP